MNLINVYYHSTDSKRGVYGLVIQITCTLNQYKEELDLAQRSVVALRFSCYIQLKKWFLKVMAPREMVSLSSLLFCFVLSTSCSQCPSRQRSNWQKCKQRLIISNFIEKQLSPVKENVLLFSVLAILRNNLLMFPETFPAKNANQIVLKIFCL